jgi:hypothetical protein
VANIVHVQAEKLVPVALGVAREEAWVRFVLTPTSSQKKSLKFLIPELSTSLKSK